MASPWKGKAREDNSEDLNPVFTYRHLLSSGLGVRNPLRVCGLTDMDAFYAACEQNRLKVDPETPLVVRQWDALIAVNYPARKFGISRMESITSALEKCPHLCVVHVATFDPSHPDAKPVYLDHPNSETHKVSLDYYRKESKKIMQLFKEMLPDAEIERASIDEAFIDFTEPVRKYILSLMPHLATPPSTGLDTPLPPPPTRGLSLPYPTSRADPSCGSGLWEDLGILVPLSGKPPESSQPKGTITESQNLPPQTPQKQASFRIDRQSPDGTRQTAPADYSRHANYADALGTDEDQPSQQEDAYLDDKHDAQSPSEIELSPPNWHDIALSIAASFLLRMRNEVKSRLGYTTSAGLARNKFLAKLVASYKKRDSQTILRNLAIPNYLRPIAFQKVFPAVSVLYLKLKSLKIRFLGGKLGKAIAESYEAKTVGDLLVTAGGDYDIPEEMQHRFGDSSIWVWEILRGIDRSEGDLKISDMTPMLIPVPLVREKPPVPKSMAASKNLIRPVAHPSEGQHWLWILSGELAFRLQEARQDNPGLWPKTLVLHIRHSHNTSRSKQAAFPFSRKPGLEYICKAAEKLWTELVGTASEYDTTKARGCRPLMQITNIALSFTNVETMASGQRTIEGFLPQNSNKRKQPMDESIDPQRGQPVKQLKLHDSSHNVDLPWTKDTSAASSIGFRCIRCHKWMQRNIQRDIDREVALASLKMEHDDFHLAQDLAEADNDTLPFSKEGGGSKTKSKGNGRSLGIERFFTPQTASKKK